MSHVPHHPSAGNPSPRLVVWEVAAACAEGHQAEHKALSTTEGRDLIEQIAASGPPHPALLLTNAALPRRADLLELVRYARACELHVSLAPARAPQLGAADLRAWKDAGVGALILALDGSTPELHDRLHHAPGAFACIVAVGRAAQALGLALQIRSTITRANLADLPSLFALVRGLEPTAWHASFPGSTDWAHVGKTIAAVDYEAVLNFLYDAGRFLRVTTNAGRHFRRVALQRVVLEAWHLSAEHHMRLNNTYRRLKAGLHAVTWGAGRPPTMVGRHSPTLHRSQVLIAHQGDVFIDGDRAAWAGNIREAPLADIYARRGLTRPPQAEERCIRCEFQRMCGVVQLRLSPLPEKEWAEPACAYEPGTFAFVSDVLALAGIHV